MMKILREEAFLIRREIELISYNDSFFFNPDFPVNACKHASQLYCYHMERKGYIKPMNLVFGVSKMRVGEVGHWWVESEGVLIDLTADQFNVIDDNELSYKIKRKRQYLPVYCCLIENAPHTKVFDLVPKERWAWNLDEISETYIEDLELLYGGLKL